MDKLKEQLAVVKEHSFWILCGGILVVSLASWYVSTGNLQTKQKQYKGEIETAVSTLKQVLQTADHPNESTSKGMDAVTLSFGEDVYQAWLRLSENQERVLVWGGFFGTDERFQREVRPLRPIETKVGDAEVITTDSRNLYREYIDEELPKLAEIINSKWRVDARAAGSGSGIPGAGGAGPPGGEPPGGLSGGAGMPGMPGVGGVGDAKDDDPSVIVSWNPGNQKEISNVHFSLATNEAIPGTLEVLYAQEDLWVFENLMNIIRATNEGATRKHEAAIKYVDYVRIGRSAGDVAGQVTMVGGNNSAASGSGGMPGGAMPGGAMPGGAMPGGATPGGATPGGATPGGATPGGATPGGAMPGGAMPGGAMPGGAMPGGAASGGAASAATLASGRYVDLSYASILDINRLKNAMKGQATKPEDMLLAVAKRMPVRMQFKMDQRKLTALLAECGNSKLPVEVRQVRINREKAGSSGDSGGTMGTTGGMPGAAGAGAGMQPPGDNGAGFGGGGAMPGMPGSGSGSGRGSARPSSGIASSKEDPNEITVEIYGIVYIYNPPDRKLLGIPDPPGTNPSGTLPGPTTTPTSTAPPTAPPSTAGAATGR